MEAPLRMLPPAPTPWQFNVDPVGMRPNWGEIRLLSFLWVTTALGTYSCIVQMCGTDSLFYDSTFYSLFPLNVTQLPNIWALFLGAL